MEFELRKIPFADPPELKMFYRGNELKAVSELTQVYSARLLNYLKTMEYKSGFLFLDAPPRVGI